MQNAWSLPGLAGYSHTGSYLTIEDFTNPLCVLGKYTRAGRKKLTRLGEGQDSNVEVLVSVFRSQRIVRRKEALDVPVDAQLVRGRPAARGRAFHKASEKPTHLINGCADLCM